MPRTTAATTRARSTWCSRPPATTELRDEQRRRREAGDPSQLGIGLATYVEITNGIDEAEFGAVTITPEGKAIARTGSFSHGQGHETTFAMIVAARLGLPVEDVTVEKGDTDNVPRGTGTYGSKSTQLGGSTVSMAAEGVVEQAKQLAADLLEASAGRHRARSRRGRVPRRRRAAVGAHLEGARRPCRRRRQAG